MNPTSPKNCLECKLGNIEYIYEFGNHIFIEPYGPITKIQTQNKSFDLSVVLNNIPKRLTVHEQLYNLRGIINFIPPVSRNLNEVRHYVTFCWRESTNKWEKYDDLYSLVRNIRPYSIFYSK